MDTKSLIIIIGCTSKNKAAETLGIYCYDAGFYYGKAKAQGGGASE